MNKNNFCSFCKKEKNAEHAQYSLFFTCDHLCKIGYMFFPSPFSFSFWTELKMFVVYTAKQALTTGPDKLNTP
jgi:hypothetical protein